MISYRVYISSLINYSPYLELLSYYCKYLLKALILSSYRFIVYTIYNRLNKALGYDIKTIYILRARCMIYCSYNVASFYTLLHKFVVSTG